MIKIPQIIIIVMNIITRVMIIIITEDVFIIIIEDVVMAIAISEDAEIFVDTLTKTRANSVKYR
jgi:hypothetical protein